MFKRYQVDQKQVSTVNAVGQFLLNNERQRFELWGRAYNFRARAPTERRIIPRESSGNALEPHAEGSIWLHLGFFRFFSFFKNIFDTELTSSPGYTPLVAIEKIAGEKRWKLFRWTQTSRRIRTPFRPCCTRFLRQVVRVLA